MQRAVIIGVGPNRRLARKFASASPWLWNDAHGEIHWSTFHNVRDLRTECCDASGES